MAERVSRVEAECALVAAVCHGVSLRTWRRWRDQVRRMLAAEGPSIYREAALELMEHGRLTVQDETAMEQVRTLFDREMQSGISAWRRPDGRWEMALRHAAGDGKAQT